jgi:hypothetical protein
MGFYWVKIFVPIPIPMEKPMENPWVYPYPCNTLLLPKLQSSISSFGSHLISFKLEI